MASPKLFVSYSWTNPEHIASVLKLATDLRESGVDVVLDKWDLREGHDAHAFMEKMVADPEIGKVILVCDKAYVEKANGRNGGVGTEAQIISGEIYAKQAQDKFVVVATERDEAGKAYRPAYYGSRIYIDLTDASTYPENFDQLLRWAFGQPLYQKPAIGKMPSFLSGQEGTVTLATSSRLRRAVEATKNNRDHAHPAITEYLECLAEELEKFRISPRVEPFDDAVINSIHSFLPYRNEAIELFLTLALYRDTLETRIALHRFFERLIPYLDRPAHIDSEYETDFDNFKFIVHELFLYAVGCLIRYERFESAAYLMRNDYYVPGSSVSSGSEMSHFGTFHQHIVSLLERNSRLNLRQLSLHANLLKERCIGLGIEFRHLMQADFVLFLRDHLDRPDEFVHWGPETLLYARGQVGAFEVFARSRSASYFERTKVLLGIKDKEGSLGPLLRKFQTNGRLLPNWQHISISPVSLVGFNEIASKP